ncbi:MAG: hypothetical protein WDO56_11775 [Gammaproteobacteria bacterium]
MLSKLADSVQNNFNLKNVAVDLFRSTHTPEQTKLSISDLEMLRTQRSAITASKFGLETVCGASCETGAQ